MQFQSHANQSHFHKNSFALRLALKQRYEGTRKWPILFFTNYATVKGDERCYVVLLTSVYVIK